MNAASDFIVAYDVSDDRTRRRLFRLLKGFGEPCQRSVFVCPLDGKRRLRLERAIARLPLAAADRCSVLALHQPLAAGSLPVRPVRAGDVLVCE